MTDVRERMLAIFEARGAEKLRRKEVSHREMSKRELAKPMRLGVSPVASKKMRQFSMEKKIWQQKKRNQAAGES